MGFEHQESLCNSSAQESMAAQPPVLLPSPQGLFDGHNSVMSCVVDGWVAVEMRNPSNDLVPAKDMDPY